MKKILLSIAAAAALMGAMASAQAQPVYHNGYRHSAPVYRHWHRPPPPHHYYRRGYSRPVYHR